MGKIYDCNNVAYPEFAKGTVVSCTPVEGAFPQKSVYALVLDVKGERKPQPGQFYMLHAIKSDTLLGRPISVFHAEQKNGFVEITFLILVKGKGTKELCALNKNDQISILGPLGNVFAKPEKGKALIVGGGIGVAPVAGFAESLKDKTYDFYASFKSGSYGLENIKPEKLVITTDDGSVGVHGMLPAALTAETLKENNYSAVYACGPAPMLAYVKKIAEEAGIICWLSMEARMACGMGVCLGCTIDTTEGNKRCCKDGPVFDSRIIKFPQFADSFSAKKQKCNAPLTEEPDMSVTIKGVKLNNPLIGSSGTFGFGTEYAPVFDVNRLGGIASKGLTLEPRQGNSGIRLWETPSGLMNSIGLQNPGIPHFIEHELPEMLKLKPVTIANLSGSSLESYTEGAKLLDKTEVPIIELNISCPNVAAGGASFGMTCALANQAVSAVRAVTKKPLLVKLTPQSPDLLNVAMQCIKSGADGISLCNSFQGVAIDIERGVPVFDKVKAGFGGPAVRPIAMRLIYELYEEINKLPEAERVPIIAIGGIEKWEDVVEFVMCGASAVEVGTNTFANPFTMIECIDGLNDFMKRKGYKNLEQMRGIAHQ
ncbi:MAG: dihydroorotate dehydrogenase [Treponemataceae bacterium]|nr:dihydroorotate dehydrogenase [Treponemataceae bacterium]